MSSVHEKEPLFRITYCVLHSSLNWYRYFQAISPLIWDEYLSSMSLYENEKKVWFAWCDFPHLYLPGKIYKYIINASPATLLSWLTQVFGRKEAFSIHVLETELMNRLGRVFLSWYCTVHCSTYYGSYYSIHSEPFSDLQPYFLWGKEGGIKGDNPYHRHLGNEHLMQYFKTFISYLITYFSQNVRKNSGFLLRFLFLLFFLQLNTQRL